MITCREIADFLMDYRSGVLPPAQRKLFDDHLMVCPECVAYLRTYEQTIALGKGACAEPHDALEDDMPEELVQAILAARGKP